MAGGPVIFTEGAAGNIADTVRRVLRDGGDRSAPPRRGPRYVGNDEFLARITAVSGSFPTWSYTVQRVTSYNSANSNAAKWVTNGTNITAKNGMEFGGTAPYTYGNGVTVANASTGAVATAFGGSTASTCLIRSIAVGALVWVSPLLDENGSAVYVFNAANSAQA